MLGPMTNPAKPQSQFVGVFSSDVQNLYSEVYQLTNIQHAIAYSFEGYDEISLTGDFRVLGHGKESVYSPENIGLSKVKPDELHGGNTIEEAARIFLYVLEGKGSKAQNEVVIANSAFALACYYPETPLADCIEMAKESLKSGKALNVFKKLFGK